MEDTNPDDPDIPEGGEEDKELPDINFGIDIAGPSSVSPQFAPCVYERTEQKKEIGYK